MKSRAEQIQHFERKLTNAAPVKIKKYAYLSSIYTYRLLANTIEKGVAVIFILFVSIPVLLALCLRKFLKSMPMFSTVSIYGLGGACVDLKLFNSSNDIIKRSSLFIYVITGHLSLVGIRIKAYEKKSIVLGDSYLLNSKPGVFNLSYIREASKLDHENDNQVGREYLCKKSIVNDILLIFKSLPAALFHSSTSNYNDQINLFDVKCLNMKMSEAVELILNKIESKEKSRVFFVNPDCLNKIFDDHEYHSILKSNQYNFPDGIGINIACNILHSPLKQNINGTDMLPFLCDMAQHYDKGIYLLGARDGVAKKMRANLEKSYPRLRVCGDQSGMFDLVDDSANIVQSINESGADILLVAFGAPIQEKWISQNINNIDASVVMGVGGLFDFYSGNTKRAPKWMREIGLEWLFRMIQEPGRMWRRYIIGNPLFILRVLRWKLSKV